MTLVIRFNSHQGRLTEILVDVQQDHRISPLLWRLSQKCKKQTLWESYNYNPFQILPKLRMSHLHLRMKVSVGHVLQCQRLGCYFSLISTALKPHIKLTISPQHILEEDESRGNTESFCDFRTENTRCSDWHSNNFWNHMNHILQCRVSHKQRNLSLIYRNTVFCLQFQKKNQNKTPQNWNWVVNF